MLKQPEHIFLYIRHQEDVIREWFSGEIPEVGATYGHRVTSVINKDGFVEIEMKFVRIDKE